MTESTPSDPSRTGVVSIGELDTDEPICEARTAAQLDDETVVSAAEADEFDRWLDETDAEDWTESQVPPGLGPAGGGCGGAGNPGKRAMRIATRNGLTITSTKRSSPPATSDHHTSQTRAFAVDMSNGSGPTPQMDHAARQIAKRLGHPGFEAGNLVVSLHGYRVQLLYWTHIGGNDFNHVHVGIRML